MTDIHALAGAYALDAVDDVERAAFARHVADCESCAIEVAELRETVTRLADSTWSVPPPRLRTQVLAQVRRTRQDGPGRVDRGGLPALSRWRRRTAIAVAAATLAAGAGAGTWAFQEQRVRREQALTQAARAETERVRAVLAAPDAVVRTVAVPSGGRVTVVLSVSQDRAVALLDGLVGPGADRAYQLWLVDSSGAASAGVLAAGESTATVLIGGVRGKASFAVTEEPDGGSVRATTDAVVTLAIT